MLLFKPPRPPRPGPKKAEAPHPVIPLLPDNENKRDLAPARSKRFQTLSSSECLAAEKKTTKELANDLATLPLHAPSQNCRWRHWQLTGAEAMLQGVKPQALRLWKHANERPDWPCLKVHADGYSI